MPRFSRAIPIPVRRSIYEFHQWPDHDRIEYTKHRDVVQFFVGRQGWEVTYRGKKPLEKDIVDDFLRRRDHSIETAVKVWMKDPNTILMYEGQHLAERHLAEQVSLISAQNEAITILMDVQTHLPLQSTFQWRDPIYHDKNSDTEEYDDYHTIQGFPTPLTITRLKNGETVRQYYVTTRDLQPESTREFLGPGSGGAEDQEQVVPGGRGTIDTSSGGSIFIIRR